MEWGKAYTWILDFRLENNDMKCYKATLIEKIWWNDKKYTIISKENRKQEI